jgi:predicted ATPase
VLVSAATAHLLSANNNLLLVDLGEHRLKDLSAPERIYQLGSDAFPPLKSLHQTNLPIPATPFLGRERELGEVRELLARDDVRLLTLAGPGGTGKTRLGLQAAAEASERYPDGVWWVPLAPLRDSELVLETAAQALGAQDGLAEHIADKSLLVLFDNFEHVVDAAADLSELLAACPNLHLLVTSRELLRVPGEQAYAVPPLEPEEGTQLFVTRAQAAEPSFEPTPAVQALCGRLENLPLALELAAARVRVLSPEQLLERLSTRLDVLKAGRGVDPRQQTLRATIEWSHDLLDEEERRLFARLSVFRGGCTLEAAEQVCDADIDILQSLVDKSLVRVREGERFWMLETIREYAAERLEASGDAEHLHSRHAAHFLALAEGAEPHLLGGSSSTWLDRLEREHDNLRAALDWLETGREGEGALRLAGALSRFWSHRGHHVEGRRRLESALSTERIPTAARAKALNGAALMAVTRGDAAAARLRAEEGLEIHRKLGDAWGTACSTYMLGVAVRDEGDFVKARPLFEESARSFRELGDEPYAGLAKFNLAWMYGELGEIDRERALHEENLRRARETGDRAIEAASMDSLAWFARKDGRVEQAIAMLRESLRVYRDLGDVMKTGDSLSRIAHAFAINGRAATATQLLSSSQALYEESGVSTPAWVEERNQETFAAIRMELDDAPFTEAWEEGRALTLDEAVAVALGKAD